MELKDFDYSLPRRFIAQYPPQKRGESRLLVLHRKSGDIEHRMFSDIVRYFSCDDVLCINRTRVIPARLFGRKKRTGGKVEVFLLQKKQEERWEVLLRPARGIHVGDQILFAKDALCNIVKRNGAGKWHVEFLPSGITEEEIFKLGNVPLPPYIKREAEELDKERYQTVYAEQGGSVAAPTAGLHFTEAALSAIEGKGVHLVKILVHIGMGTFKPVKVDDVREHKMDSEYFECDEKGAATINKARKQGRKIFSVGTSTTRALETISCNNFVKAEGGWTDKFIYPPYTFQVIDHLITNFHLPKTTLLMLVSAFATRELILKTYEEAKQKGYRFFSYGDAMLIL